MLITKREEILTINCSFTHFFLKALRGKKHHIILIFIHLQSPNYLCSEICEYLLPSRVVSTRFLLWTPPGGWWRYLHHLRRWWRYLHHLRARLPCFFITTKARNNWLKHKLTWHCISNFKIKVTSLPHCMSQTC